MGEVLLNPFFIAAGAAGVLLIVLALLWKRRAGAARPEPHPSPLPPSPHEAAWTGWRRFKVRKRVDEDAGGRYVSFYLSPENRRRLPAFEPGQHIRVRIEAPDPAQPGRMIDWIRPFYLSDSANGRYYRIGVQRREGGAGAEGEVSTYLIENLRKGGLVEVQSPAGACPFELDSAAPLVLIATGAGIAPLLAVCNTLIDRKSARPVSIFYGMRGESELIHLSNFEYAASHLPDAKIQLCFSETMPDGTVDGATTGDGVVYRKGSIGTAFLKKHLELPEQIYYLCGPDETLDALAADLEALGVPGDRIHRAAFSE